ncbi:MAG: SLC13 family permease [Gemmatimonadales bacterium]|nr:MAG: SLC13 family permease [Gemmatimonadales bacterium]
MTVDLVLVLLVLLGAVVSFATGFLRVDITALLVLAVVAVLGLAPADRALAGFASPAVLAIGGMYVLSAGLSRTGVADLVGVHILRWAGTGESRLMLAIVLFSGVLSGFMNNVGVAAMMLPVTVKLAREADLAPSKLLIPMALGAQLGGFTTLIGTSTNLVASDALQDAGFAPFELLGFLPVGGPLLAAGALFLLVAAPRLLPHRVPEGRGPQRPAIRENVELEERFFRLIVPRRSLLDGKTLEESLIGSALGVHVLQVERGTERILAPGPGTLIRGGDRLLVQGRPDFFMELRGRRHLAMDQRGVRPEWLEREGAGLVQLSVAPDSPLVGRSVAELDLQARHGVLVLSLLREDFRRRTHLQDTVIQGGDLLLLHGPRDRLMAFLEGSRGDAAAEDWTALPGSWEFLPAAEAIRRFQLDERLWALQVTDDSLFAGRPLGETRLGDAVGMMVLAIGREGAEGEDEAVLMPGPETVVQPGDHLLVKTRPEDMAVLRGLQRLDLEEDPDVSLDALESAGAGFVEAVVAPRSALIGKTLRQSGFRSRFGLHVVAILRDGGAIRTQLRDRKLNFGDALLLHGPRRKGRALAREPDLILLHEPDPTPPEARRAPRSIIILVAAILPVILGWLPVAVGVLAGAVGMVVTRCLTPEEAYRAVEWPVLVMVAGMLALGAALDDTGAAAFLGEGVLAATAGLGPTGVLTSLVIMAALASQIMPGPAVVVLMAPVAIAGAAQLQVSPQAMVMAVAIASTSLASPVSQPAQALVMAPAGYRLKDYLPLGIPLTLMVILLTVLITPLVFPF